MLDLIWIEEQLLSNLQNNKPILQILEKHIYSPCYELKGKILKKITTASNYMRLILWFGAMKLLGQINLWLPATVVRDKHKNIGRKVAIWLKDTK